MINVETVAAGLFADANKPRRAGVRFAHVLIAPFPLNEHRLLI
jgi:hypothetical protein